jgi:hypothetical protein
MSATKQYPIQDKTTELVCTIGTNETRSTSRDCLKDHVEHQTAQKRVGRARSALCCDKYSLRACSQESDSGVCKSDFYSRHLKQMLPKKRLRPLRYTLILSLQLCAAKSSTCLHLAVRVPVLRQWVVLGSFAWGGCRRDV